MNTERLNSSEIPLRSCSWIAEICLLQDLWGGPSSSKLFSKLMVHGAKFPMGFLPSDTVTGCRTSRNLYRTQIPSLPLLSSNCFLAIPAFMYTGSYHCDGRGLYSVPVASPGSSQSFIPTITPAITLHLSLHLPILLWLILTHKGDLVTLMD